MRDEDKPFICYKQGWNIKIMPRNAAGWRAFGYWMAALLAPTMLLVIIAFRLDDSPKESIVLWATIPMLLLTGGIAIAMIRWMKARSEIVDVDGLMEIKRTMDRQRKSNRR